MDAIAKRLDFPIVRTMDNMQTPPTNTETDIHCLIPRFSAIRLQTKPMVEAMMRSIESSGQITPVGVIQKAEHRYILMDGYLRLKALKRLGQDRAKISIWDCDEATGLLRVLSSAQAHTWAAVEEARTIRMLIDQYGRTQSDIARQVGRDVSWVNRRLSMINGINDKVLAAVCKGNLSTWSASRVIAPLARATSEHAEKMIKFLSQHSLSTRDLNRWNQHYHKANHRVREEMVKDPALFLAALTNKEQEKEAEILQQGPEGIWLKDMRVIKAMLTRSQKSVSTLFSSPYNQQDQQPLRQALQEVKSAVETLYNEVTP